MLVPTCSHDIHQRDPSPIFRSRCSISNLRLGLQRSLQYVSDALLRHLRRHVFLGAEMCSFIDFHISIPNQTLGDCRSECAECFGFRAVWGLLPILHRLRWPGWQICWRFERGCKEVFFQPIKFWIWLCYQLAMVICGHRGLQGSFIGQVFPDTGFDSLSWPF